MSSQGLEINGNENTERSRSPGGEEGAEDPDNENSLTNRFNYALLIKDDIVCDVRRKEMVEICQIACEKHAPAEKSSFERNNSAAAQRIKTQLDDKMDGPYNVIVGEAFSIDMDYIHGSLLYIMFGGYLSICVWKCIR
ncbi:DNAL4 [Lepeophtheirus salmonis]|uniref:DNAL4 n=1 Tax=Lepeophtheirus salmonis TaxID=72036 RepID=A0A7R8H5H2_LEPSM|nr:dynein light chain 4, axonemal-like [Lepeophtheirus salmonis]CAB4061345.1 DNAL4 [Lepeophtheirus salmonis]CAF2882867.1 DNAL4 [Lepeophtheirus salmonis]